MSEAAATALDHQLDDLAAVAWTLSPVPPDERKWLLRDEAAFLLDGLLGRVSRGCGALDVAIGDALASLSIGDRVLQLGFSYLGDYSRERLGIAGSTAEKLARLARGLRERPLLREAVWRGEVTARKAETVLPVARGEAEECWVARARVETVRALAAAVREARAGAEPEEEEPWERLSITVSAQTRATLDEALLVAGKLLGATSPRWQRIEAICSEFLGAQPPAPERRRPVQLGTGFGALAHRPGGQPAPKECATGRDPPSSAWSITRRVSVGLCGSYVSSPSWSSPPAPSSFFAGPRGGAEPQSIRC